MTVEQKQAVDELCEQESGLTEWEVEFVESLSRRPPGYRLTEKQAEILQRIADKFNLGIDCLG